MNSIDRGWPRGAAAVTALFFGLGWLSGCSPQAAPPVAVIRPVRTLVVSEGDDLRERIFSAKAEATRKVELAFQVAGLIVTLPIKEGQKVANGEVIAELRKDEFKARLTALQGQLDQARAGLTALRSGDRP